MVAYAAGSAVWSRTRPVRRPGTVPPVTETSVWQQYRGSWRARPWVLLVLVLGVVVLAAAIVGTATRSPAAALFVPGLAIVYVHHLLARGGPPR